MERPNLPLIFTKIGVLLAAISGWFFLTGCGPGFQTKSFYHKTITDSAPTADSEDPLMALTGETPDYTTGAYKVIQSQDGQAPVKVPYVAAGNSTLLNYLRSALGPSANATFGATIQKVKVSIAGENVTVRITFNDPTQSPVRFQAALKQKKQQMLALNMTPTGTSQNSLSLNLVCTDVSCSEIVMVLSKDANTKAGIIYRTSTPSVAFQNLDSDSANGYTVQTFKTLNNEAGKITAKRVSVTIVPGISYSDIELQDPAKKDVLTLDTDLVDTQNGSTQVSDVKSVYDQNVTGTLFANDPKTGTAMITLEKKVGTDNDEKLGLVISEPKQSQPDVVPEIVPNAPPAPPAPSEDNSDNSMENAPAPLTPPPSNSQSPTTQPPPTLPPTMGNALFQMPDRTQNPNGYQMTLGFARYANDYYVREFVRAWLGEGPMRSCNGLRDKTAASPKSYRYTLLDFLTYAPAVAPYIDKIANVIGVSPDIGYLLALETSYATNEKNPYYIAMQTARGSTALGPWQILYSTALDISKSAARDFGGEFTGFHIEASPRYFPNDDRTYFENSTLMASLYIQTLANLFPGEDPALAIMAYNAGDGTVTHARRYISNLTGGYNITFDDMIRRHVPIRLYCGAVAYTMKFLALQTIGQHPEAYGITVTPAQSDAYTSRLKNPHSQLPPQISL